MPLIRDNLVYFFLAFFILLITAIEEIQWIQSSKGLYWITFSALKYVFYGLVGPWMMLDLRKEAYGESVESSPTEIKMSRLVHPEMRSHSDCEELTRSSM